MGNTVRSPIDAVLKGGVMQTTDETGLWREGSDVWVHAEGGPYVHHLKIRRPFDYDVVDTLLFVHKYKPHLTIQEICEATALSPEWQWLQRCSDSGELLMSYARLSEAGFDVAEFQYGL